MAPRKTTTAASSKKKPVLKSTVAKKTKTTKSVSKAATKTSAKPAPKPAPAKKPSMPKLVKPSAAKGRTAATAAAPKKLPQPKSIPIVNQAPTDRLDVYVFGSNSNAELGLGDQVDSRAVTRPRANVLLEAKTAGVVDVATGAQHCVALTFAGKVLTWGANDLGALGRDTTWDGGLVDAKMGDDSDSEAEGAELNPKEATPTGVNAESFGGENVTGVAASDNASFVVTDQGHVYGWGTFRDSEGHSRFSESTEIQRQPIMISGLKNVTKLATGNDHVLALTVTGEVFAWGMNDANQLGRKIGVRHKLASLLPTKVKLPKGCPSIAAGSYHSFAIGSDGTVYAWGANNYGQTGHESGLGEGGATAVNPAPVKELKKFGAIKCIAGGEHHSIAATTDGKCLVWGRLDGSQMGIKTGNLSDDQVVKNEYGMAKILKVAGTIPSLDVAMVDASIDCCIAVTTDGTPFSWGFSESYRTGQGTDDDVHEPTQILGKAIKDKKIVWAGLGGQFGVMASVG